MYRREPAGGSLAAVSGRFIRPIMAPMYLFADINPPSPFPSLWTEEQIQNTAMMMIVAEYADDKGSVGMRTLLILSPSVPSASLWNAGVGGVWVCKCQVLLTCAGSHHNRN